MVTHCFNLLKCVPRHRCHSGTAKRGSAQSKYSKRDNHWSEQGDMSICAARCCLCRFDCVQVHQAPYPDQSNTCSLNRPSMFVCSCEESFSVFARQQCCTFSWIQWMCRGTQDLFRLLWEHFSILSMLNFGAFSRCWIIATMEVFSSLKSS